MNKKKILDYIINKTSPNTNFHEKLLEEVENAKKEIDAAHNMFNNVSDSRLIDLAIYSEDLAKRRYDYLMAMAKEKGITVGNDYIIERGSDMIK